MTNKFIIFFSGLFLSGAVGAAMVDETSLATANPFDASPTVRVVGNDAFSLAKGLGRNVSLKDALSAIIPEQYALLAPGLDLLLQSTVSWQGGRQWITVLEEALQQVPNVRADIDVSRKVVFLGVSQVTTRGQTSSNKASAQSQPIQTSSTRWNIVNGEKIGDALERWGSVSTWRVIWTPENVFAGADFMFEGSFDGAITEFVRSLNASGTKVKAVFHETNHVLQIVEVNQ